MPRLPDSEALVVGDNVETDFSGKVTRHTVTARFKVRNSETGVCYRVSPRVPKSGGLIDHNWFKRIDGNKGNI